MGYSSAIADGAVTALLGNAVLSHASYRVEHMGEALMTLPDNIIEDISVNYEGTFDSKTNTYSVTFVSPHNSGDQHMLQCNAAGCDVDGCQPRFEGLSDSAATNNVPTCVVTETRKGTTEAATCSNRGNCDGSTGSASASKDSPESTAACRPSLSKLTQQGTASTRKGQTEKDLPVHT